MSGPSPLEVLSDIVDEVEGYRCTDKRSHLPAALVRAARELLDEKTGGDGKILRSSDELVGRTIARVFDDPLRGCMLIYCSDGCFLVLDAEADDESASIHEYGNRSSGYTLEQFLRPRDLVELGLMTVEQMHEAERNAKLAAAKARADRLTLQMKLAQDELDRLGASVAASKA